MRSVYIRTLLKDLFDKKILIIISTVIFAILFALYGNISATGVLTPEALEQIAEYEEALDTYEQIIYEAQDNIALSEAQISDLKEYCNNSIYMKLDGNEIQIANTQYGITDSNNSGNTLNAWTSYINDGSLKEEIYAAWPEIPIEYLKELITCSTSGNVLSVTVMHYDADTAEELMNQIDKCIKAHKNTISSVQGDFNLKNLGSTYYTKADTGVINTQNTNLNNLKNYQNSLADYQKKLVDGRTNRDNYIKNYTPDAYGKTGDTPIKKAIKFFIFGAVFGVVLACAVITIRFIMSNRLRDEAELIQAGLPVLGELDDKNEYKPELSRSILDLQVQAQQCGDKELFLDAFGTGQDYDKVINDYTEKLKEEGFNISSGNTLLENTEEAKEAIDAKNAVLIVKIGDTRYEQIENQLNLCKKFGISVWGCVVIG